MSFKIQIVNQIRHHLEELKAQARKVQADYQKTLISGARENRSRLHGYFPRVISRGDGFYIYWQRYKMSKGKTVHVSDGSKKKFRISQMIRIKKKGAAYPRESFNCKSTPAWELHVIMVAEEQLAPIRIESMHWMQVLKTLHK